jgi:hypothetical protein
VKGLQENKLYIARCDSSARQCNATLHTSEIKHFAVFSLGTLDYLPYVDHWSNILEDGDSTVKKKWKSPWVVASARTWSDFTFVLVESDFNWIFNHITRYVQCMNVVRDCVEKWYCSGINDHATYNIESWPDCFILL